MLGDDERQILRQTLTALDMPQRGVERWLRHLERFYRQHGGSRHYGDCMALLDDLQQLLRAEGR
jgi:hypothetical protein